MKMLSYILIGCFLTSCSSLKKDNEPKSPAEVSAEVKTQLSVYRPLLKAQADKHGLMVMGGSIGDSALFSCLALAAGAAEFNPAVLFTEDGRPLRHPDIYDSAPSPGEPDYEQGKFTTISKDMVNGLLVCLHTYGKTHPTEARDLIEKMIRYGRSHKEKDLWVFCTQEDRVKYNISAERWYGRCVMTPAITKDTYRIATKLGWFCDTDCQIVMATTGTNVPTDNAGFERHLAVLTTTRNGLVDGAINDNSLKIVLENAALSQPRNAFYQASYHLFGDGDQTAAYAALQDESLFPKDALPTSANYATDYLFQRDDDSQSGRDKPDWSPSSDGSEGSEGRGIEWAFAAALALGEIH